MKIIPAIDIIEGKCVRLSQGDFTKKVIYDEDPLEVALRFEAAGLNHLHLVDLDGAKSGTVVNWKVLEKIATATALFIDFSGGLKTDHDLQVADECGADQMGIGSVAVLEPEKLIGWLEIYGPEILILSADARDEKLAVRGWQDGTDVDLLPFLQDWLVRGITDVTCTDIGQDGLLQGPSTALYKKILEALPSLRLTASGGVSSLKDLEDLRATGLAGAIVGKALYEGKLSPKELFDFGQHAH